MSLASSYTANNSSRKSSSNSSSSRKSSNSSRKSSRVTFAPNLVQDGIRKQASSQSLPLASALAGSRKSSSEVNSRKSSSKSDGAVASTSRKVSFVDELTGAPARPDPKFERELQAQLEIVKESGEMGQFMS